MDKEESLWKYLPYTVLFKIFNYLEYKDVIAAGRACTTWFDVSRDEFLWKDLFQKSFLVDKTIPLITGRTWYEEFKRLKYHIPIVQTETLGEHAHQVLHVSFSHNGKYFATCSKDGYVILWDATYPASIKYSSNMKTFSWKYTQYSQFNESDTLLLVSGVHFGTPHSTSGEIAVFSLQEGFELQCRVVNKPYDIFGTWYSDHYLLSGDLHWLAHLVSSSYLWLNKASQEAESEHVPITHNMFKFYNRNASSIRSIMIANCLPNSENAAAYVGGEQECDSNKGDGDKLQHGNPLSHRELRGLAFPSSGGARVEEPSTSVAPSGSHEPIAYPIWYNAEYRRVEFEKEMFRIDDDDDELTEESSKEEIFEFEDDLSECSMDADSEQVIENDKYLIFTTGSKTYTPHQIGFKRITPFTFPKRMDPGPSLKERLILHERKKELMKSGSPPPEPNWLDFDSVADKFDKIDHLIDLHGHIVGMGLSPDHRYLYVNSRSWPEGYKIRNPLDPPPIAQEIDIHVIDLVTLKEVGTMLRSHKAYTPNNECFFIFLDVCNEYVASGAEDKYGYLWDRHYGICLARYPHADVVNSVAFNPTDPEMLVTTSDDFIVKIWRSRSKVKELGIKQTDLPEGVDLNKNKLKNRRKYRSKIRGLDGLLPQS